MDGEGCADNKEMENEAMLWEKIEGEQLAAVHEWEGSRPVVFAESTGKMTLQAPGWTKRQDETEKVIWDKWKEESRRKIDSNLPPL